MQDARAAEAELIALEAERCRAITELDLATLDRLLAAELSHTHVNGVTQTKAEYLAAVEQRPRATRRAGVQVQVFGDAAVMTGLLFNTFPGSTAAPRPLQALQLWLRRDDAWQQVAFCCTGPVTTDR